MTLTRYRVTLRFWYVPNLVKIHLRSWFYCSGNLSVKPIGHESQIFDFETLKFVIKFIQRPENKSKSTVGCLNKIIGICMKFSSSIKVGVFIFSLLIHSIYILFFQNFLNWLYSWKAFWNLCNFHILNSFLLFYFPVSVFSFFALVKELFLLAYPYVKMSFLTFVWLRWF